MPDHSIIAAGNLDKDNEALNNIILVKYDASGNLDAAFGNNGKAIVQINETTKDDQIYNAILGPDNKILATGYSKDGTNRNFLLVKILLDGSLDSGFGSNGYQIYDLGTAYDIGRVVTYQPDGKMLCGGTSANGDEELVTAKLLRLVGQNLTLTTTSTTGSLTAYPNPFADHIDIRSSRKQENILFVDLIDNLGRNIMRLKPNGFSTDGSTTRMNVPETLPKGIYFLKIQDGKNTQTVKILK